MSLEKIFFKVIGPILFIMGLYILKDAYDNNKKNYHPLQEKASYLLALKCIDQECITEGKIQYIETEKTYYRRRWLASPPIYHYRYSFDVENKQYTSNLLIFSERDGLQFVLRYMPSARTTYGNTFLEKIIFDPSNPEINLPIRYAQVLPQIPSPYENYMGYLGILMGLYFTVAFSEKKKSSDNEKTSLN